MFEAFYWMFKQPEFKRHFRYLFLIYIVFIAVAAACLGIGELFFKGDVLISLIILLIFFLLIISPFLCFQGYFWELTENIINRQMDIDSNSVYDGKLKEVYKIELPEIDTKRFIWRGIASIVATVLLFYPLIILFVLSSFSEISEFYNLGSYSVVMYIVLFLLVGSFIPALLWNYARRDSIFAVWNLPKAIHIMGTYFGRYIWNTALFLICVVINYFVSMLLTSMLGLSGVVVAYYNNAFIIAKGIIFVVVNYTLSIYWLYVNAYLLGTIAPISEA